MSMPDTVEISPECRFVDPQLRGRSMRTFDLDELFQTLLVEPNGRLVKVKEMKQDCTPEWAPNLHGLIVCECTSGGAPSLSFWLELRGGFVVSGKPVPDDAYPKFPIRWVEVKAG